MSGIKYKAGQLWYSPCDTPVRIYRDGAWRLVIQGTKYFYNSSWQTLQCGVTGTWAQNTIACEFYTGSWVQNTTQCEVI